MDFLTLRLVITNIHTDGRRTLSCHTVGKKNVRAVEVSSDCGSRIGSHTRGHGF